MDVPWFARPAGEDHRILETWFANRVDSLLWLENEEQPQDEEASKEVII